MYIIIRPKATDRPSKGLLAHFVGTFILVERKYCSVKMYFFFQSLVLHYYYDMIRNVE